jgi:glycosyltransferase involved in cell wall biosynthesis
MIPLSKQELQQQFPEMVIQVIRLAQNGGIVNALNTGLNALRSRNDLRYIARLDTGDTCHSQRFYKQVDFLNGHPDITLLASWARFQNQLSNSGYDYITKTTHDQILKEMHYKCSFIHPSVMFRTEVLDKVGIYPENFPHAEDYAFFWKIIKLYKGAVLPEILVYINFSDKSMSSKNYKEQLNSRKKIVKEFGDNKLYKLIGVGMLNLKWMMTKKIRRILKSI